MTSYLLCFSTVLIFVSFDPCWSMEHHSKGGVEPVLWSLAPYLWGLDLAPWRDGEACFFLFFLFLHAHHPENEILALAVHVSISIPASLQVIACFCSFWWGTQVSFKYVLHFSWTLEVHLVCYRRLMIENKCQGK